MSELLPGFADPVRDSQSVFRAVMDATARPGRIHRVSGPTRPPAPLDRATAAVLLTLIDAETPLWLDAGAAEAAGWIAFHCGAPLVRAEAAQFAVALAGVALETLSAGTDEEPERSTTLVLQVAALGLGETLRLSGPGLAGEERLDVIGLPDRFRTEWAANRRRFPCGVDVILCAGDAVAVLPRTVGIG